MHVYLHSYLYLISVSELVSIYCYFMTPTTTSRSTAAAIATTTAITILLGHLRHTKSYPEGVAQPSIASRGKSMHAIGFRREEARSRMKVRMRDHVHEPDPQRVANQGAHAIAADAYLRIPYFRPVVTPDNCSHATG